MAKLERKNQAKGLWSGVFRLSIFSLSFILCLCFWIYTYAQEGFVYDAKGRRDPFTPLVTPDGRLLKLDVDTEAGPASLSIEGIIYDERGLSYGIVNGEVVKVGDAAGGYQVLKIEKNKIAFIKDGKITEVQLKEEE